MGVLRLGAMCSVSSAQVLRERLDAVTAAGVDCVQVTVPRTISGQDWAELLGECKRRGVRVAALGCYANLARPEHPGLHGTTVADVEIAFAALAAQEGPIPRQVVVWSGTFGPDLLADDPRNGTMETWEALVEVTARLARRGRELGCRLLLEPYSRHCLGTARDYLLFLRSALQAAGLPADPARAPVGVVLDAPNLVGTDSLGQLDAHLRTDIGTLGAWAGLVHLKDIAPPADGQGVPALPPPGAGVIDYPAYLHCLAAGVEGQVAAIAEHYHEADPAALAQVVAFLRSAGGGTDLAVGPGAASSGPPAPGRKPGP